MSHATFIVTIVLALFGETAQSADYVAMSGKDLYGRFCAACHGVDLSRLEIGNPDAERAARTVIDRLADYLWQLQRPAPH